MSSISGNGERERKSDIEKRIVSTSLPLPLSHTFFFLTKHCSIAVKLMLIQRARSIARYLGNVVMLGMVTVQNEKWEKRKTPLPRLGESSKVE